MSDQKVTDAGLEDNRTTCLQALRSRGYAAHTMRVSPEEVGCPESRSRDYYISLNIAKFADAVGGPTGEDEMFDFANKRVFDTIALALEIQSVHEVHALADFLLPKDHEIVLVAQAAAKAKSENFVRAQPHKVKKLAWHDEHKQAFLDIGIEWQLPDFNSRGADLRAYNYFFAALPAREQDIVLYADLAKPLREDLREEEVLNLYPLLHFVLQHVDSLLPSLCQSRV